MCHIMQHYGFSNIAEVKPFSGCLTLSCMFLFNIGCIGSPVTLLLSTHITAMAETFYFKMADMIAVFFCCCFFNVKENENQMSPH